VMEKMGAGSLAELVRMADPARHPYPKVVAALTKVQ
jgi:hypothetical protein